MVLYGYDASVYNAVQGSYNWKEWFNHPDDNMLGLINTVYTVGAIISGFFLGGPVADRLGRRAGMGIGAILVCAKGQHWHVHGWQSDHWCWAGLGFE
jgi:MFS family permease